MRNFMMKKAISLALVSAIFIHLSQGMEVQTSTQKIKEAHPSSIYWDVIPLFSLVPLLI